MYYLFAVSDLVTSIAMSGCAVAWVTIARDSESDYPFYSDAKFRKIRAGHLWYQISSSLTN